MTTVDDMVNDPEGRRLVQEILSRKRMDAAVEAAAAVLVREQSGGFCQLGKVCQLCDCYAGMNPGLKEERDRYAREHARAALEAALPHLENKEDA